MTNSKTGSAQAAVCGTQSYRNGLRNFSAVHIDETFEEITGTHENALFYNCTFKKVTGARLINCVLDHSRFISEDVQDFIGLSVTLDCFTFHNLELSDTAFDAFMLLFLKTKGNTAKRQRLIEVIGRERVVDMLKQFATLER